MGEAFTLHSLRPLISTRAIDGQSSGAKRAAGDANTRPENAKPRSANRDVIYKAGKPGSHGAAGEDRTHDLSLTKGVLYH
jgi:hypothetical protein